VTSFGATELIILGVTIAVALLVFRALNARANRDSKPPDRRRRE
jgi:hypothetical protein